MLTKTLSYFALSLLALGDSLGNSEPQLPAKSPDRPSGTLERMIVANGTVAMDLDLNRLRETDAVEQGPDRDSFRFEVGPNSFFTIRVFNKVLRGPEPGSMELISRNVRILPEPLNASANRLVLERVNSSNPINLVVRDGQTGFVFFNVEGALYEYEAAARLLGIKGGRLLISQELANKLGHPDGAGAVVGEISIAAAMELIEITTVAEGVAQSTILPPRVARAPAAPEGSVPGPDIIVGDLPSLEQFGAGGSQVGLGVGTTSCNNGNIEVDWFQLPDTDHCVIPQNLYRMSGGPNNNDRFEQIGQSWMKHAFFALQFDDCGFGCIPAATGEHLGVGCSDPYDASLNADQGSLGSRAWVNPFTGAYPSTSANHAGHTHTGTSHRIIVGVNDLNTTMNPGATYFAEAQYVTPHEYAWCQTHPGQCNMYNNASYRQFSVNGTTSFNFSPIGSTVRMTPAINAWPGATIRTIEPEPGVDGRAFLAYKVTNSGGVWHYEYAIYNQNLDRGIQSLTIPLPTPLPFLSESTKHERAKNLDPGPIGDAVLNPGFHAPPQQPGFPADGTVGDAGYSNAPWTFQFNGFILKWNSETFAQDPNANAIRWGTLYNFRYDSSYSPITGTATIGFFKIGAPITVPIAIPFVPSVGPPTPTPPPTPTATPTPSPTPCPSCTPTPLPSATPTPTDPPCLSVVYSEDFDGVKPPALPPGWESSAAAGPANCTPSGVCSEGGFWATTTDLPHTGPNSVYHNAPGCVTDSVLDFPATFAPIGAFELQFWQSYNLDTNLDGAVLEVSIDGGNFTDIIDAGGTFTRGGYNGTISTGFLSPIAGRQAWTGASGYSPVGVLFPSAMTSKTVFRFRLATDCSGSGAGWRIDSLRVVVSNCKPTPTPDPTPTPTSPPGGSPTPTPPAQAINLSTRLLVDTGDNVGIAGFIITGPVPKQVLMRGLGPSLAGPGVPNPLADPVLELHGPNIETIVCDNWKECPGAQNICDLGICPTNNLDAAMLVSLDPGAYTLILRGNETGTGVGLVEIYDLYPAASKLANISTRAFVGTGSDIVIAGFILGSGSSDDTVLLRGLGPSLEASDVSDVLANPTLELRNSDGAVIATNDDWQSGPPVSLPPTDPLESAIETTLAPGAYTALLSAVNDGTGVGLVEVYDLGSP